VSNGGMIFTYEETIHFETARLSVFTQMPEEEESLGQWGAGVEIDGTDDL
jgi:hypothetical protein